MHIPVGVQQPVHLRGTLGGVRFLDAKHLDRDPPVKRLQHLKLGALHIE